MKPRIRRKWSLKADRVMWFCFDGRGFGFGNTPMEAFSEWKRDYDKAVGQSQENQK